MNSAKEIAKHKYNGNGLNVECKTHIKVHKVEMKSAKCKTSLLTIHATLEHIHDKC